MDRLSVKEASKDSIFQSLVGGNLTHLLVQTNVTDYQNESTAEPPQPTSTVINQDIINIEDVPEPTLFSAYENVTLPTPSALSAKCPEGVLYGYFEWNSGLEGCPMWMRSHSDLESYLEHDRKCIFRYRYSYTSRGK